MIESLKYAYDRDNKVVILFIDLPKAFDTPNQKLLLAKMDFL